MLIVVLRGSNVQIKLRQSFEYGNPFKVDERPLLQVETAKLLCNLDMYMPPMFSDIMVHPLAHWMVWSHSLYQVVALPREVLEGTKG